MFIGQAIARTFTPIITQVLQLAGIFSFFGSILTAILFPLLWPFIQVLINIGKWLMDNKETWGALIGILIIAGAIFGSLMAGVGSLALFLTGLAAAATYFGMSVVAILGWLGLFALLAAIVITNWDLVSKFFINFGGLIASIFFGIITVIAQIIITILSLFWNLGESIVGVLTGSMTLEEAFANIVNGVKTQLDSLWSYVVLIAGYISDALYGIGEAVFGAIGRVGDFLGGLFGGGRQFGGEIKENGMYYLHAGEEVISNSPAGYQGERSVNNTFNVSAQVSSDYDVAVLASQLSRYWGEQLG
jgi:hypothetical protein